LPSRDSNRGLMFDDNDENVGIIGVPDPEKHSATAGAITCLALVRLQIAEWIVRFPSPLQSHRDRFHLRSRLARWGAGWQLAA